jgi:hypothetical protein
MVFLLILAGVHGDADGRSAEMAFKVPDECRAAMVELHEFIQLGGRLEMRRDEAIVSGPVAARISFAKFWKLLVQSQRGEQQSSVERLTAMMLEQQRNLRTLEKSKSARRSLDAFK